MLINNTWLAVTWGFLCGDIQRHRWAALPLVDGSDGHRVSSGRTQVVECVWGDSAEQIRVLCGVGLHTVNGELQVQETYNKDTFSHKWKLVVTEIGTGYEVMSGGVLRVGHISNLEAVKHEFSHTLTYTQQEEKLDLSVLCHDAWDQYTVINSLLSDSYIML